ncbi:MAG: hypothetical protein ChlgKO_07590 [Chlamydiales bacterium]
MNPIRPQATQNEEVYQNQPDLENLLERVEGVLDRIQNEGANRMERLNLLPPPKNKEERIRWILRKFPGLSSEEMALQRELKKNRPGDPTAATERLRLLDQFMIKNPFDVEAKLEYCGLLIQVQNARRELGEYNEENFPVEKLVSVLKNILRLRSDDVEAKRFLSLQFRHRGDFAEARKYIDDAFLDLLKIVCSVISESQKVLVDEGDQSLEDLFGEDVDSTVYNKKIFTSFEESPSGEMLSKVLNLLGTFNIHGPDATKNLTKFLFFTIIDRVMVDITEMEEVVEARTEENFSKAELRLEFAQSIHPSYEFFHLFLDRLQALRDNRDGAN